MPFNIEHVIVVIFFFFFLLGVIKGVIDVLKTNGRDSAQSMGCLLVSVGGCMSAVRKQHIGYLFNTDDMMWTSSQCWKCIFLKQIVTVIMVIYYYSLCCRIYRCKVKTGCIQPRLEDFRLFPVQFWPGAIKTWEAGQELAFAVVLFGCVSGNAATKQTSHSHIFVSTGA